MTLNNYRNEAGEFMAEIGAGDEHVSKILGWLDEEIASVNSVAAGEDLPKLRHQIYDVLFQLFELAAKYDLDLDTEWTTGWERKRKKYLKG